MEKNEANVRVVAITHNHWGDFMDESSAEQKVFQQMLKKERSLQRKSRLQIKLGNKSSKLEFQKQKWLHWQVTKANFVPSVYKWLYF